MKKLMKVIKITLIVLISIIVFLFICSVINNKIKLNKESKKIEDYGSKVKVSESNINFQTFGNGDKTIVLLPGYMTASPIIDFNQLIEKLENDFKVVAIEPLGYGLSDDTDKERSVENLTEEIHEVLSKEGINKYVLMGHSISGVYSLKYIEKYPDEVEAFIGIDSSLPSQGDADDNKEGTIKFLSKSGLYRILTEINPDMLNTPDVNSELKEQYNYISMKNIGSKATMNEGKSMEDNFKKTLNISYPKELPILYFLATESTESDNNWLTIHENMVKNSNKSKIEVLDGEHYLHHTKANEIANMTKEFLLK